MEEEVKCLSCGKVFSVGGTRGRVLSYTSDNCVHASLDKDNICPNPKCKSKRGGEEFILVANNKKLLPRE